ncbi:MAG: LamG domain-containing protein, partial [Nanoarchaeota archaeon]
MAGKYKLLLILTLLVFLLSFASAASINVSFGPGTPSNGSTQTSTSIYVNLTVNASADHYSFIDFDNDLLLWMRMDDTNSSGDPTDLSSYSNNGSLIGNAGINSSSGYWGNGSYYDGIGDYIVINEENLLEDQTQGTMCVWFYTVESGTQGVVGDRNDGNDKNWTQIWLLSNGEISFGCKDDTTEYAITFGTNWQTDKWTFVCGTWNATGIYKYLNGGIDVASTTKKCNFPKTNIYDVHIGTYYTIGNSAWTFNGTIDDVMIFNRSLGSDEIQSLYNSSEYSYEHNFIGLSESVHTFTGYAVDKSGDRNQTNARIVNVTADITLPDISLVYPQSTTYHHNVSTLNYTVSDENIDSCWYSIDNGAANSSAVSCGINFTGITSVEGSNTWTVWAN